MRSSRRGWSVSPWWPSHPSLRSRGIRQYGRATTWQAGITLKGGCKLPDPEAISWPSEAPGRASGQWWPAELGLPNGSGGRNQVRYAYFNATHRLAVELNGHVTVYDSLD